MPTDRREGPVIAVVGTGQAGVAALIATIVDVAYRTRDGAPATTVVVIDTKDHAPPRGDTLYPLGGPDAANLHPFNADAPPDGFPTFGAWVQETLKEDPGLQDALTTPTYRQVDRYLDYILELAAISFSDQVQLEVNRGAISDVVQAAPDGPAVIRFVDGTSLDVARLIRATRTPHLAASVPGNPGADPTRDATPPVSQQIPGTREYFWERIVRGQLTHADAAAMLKFVTLGARAAHGGQAPAGAAEPDDGWSLTDFEAVVHDINGRGDSGEQVALATLVGGDFGGAAQQFETLIANSGDRAGDALWSKGALFVTVDPAVTRDAWERLLQVSADRHHARCAYGRLLERMGEVSDAEAVFHEVIRRAGDDSGLQAMATDCLGQLAERRNDHESAARHFERSLQLYRSLRDTRGVRRLVEMLGWIAFERDEPVIAQAYMREALDLDERAQDSGGLRRLLGRLAEMADARGETASAAQWRERLARS